MFSKTTEYALRAAVCLASSKEPTTAQRIARSTGVPVGYMSKVLNALVRAGLVSSQRGPAGGFVLARLPSQISMLDVVNSVEPLPRVLGCPLGVDEHTHSLCPLHNILDRLAENAEQLLSRTTLSDLLSSPIMPLGAMNSPKCHGPVLPVISAPAPHAPPPMPPRRIGI